MIRYLFILCTILIIGCQGKTTGHKTDDSDSISVDTVSVKTVDTMLVAEPIGINLDESYHEDDEIVNDYLLDELKPIRENFKRINSINNWTLIDKMKYGKQLREEHLTIILMIRF